jgi:serine/threonine protein kinase/formylglycine-generating enzyme required for sulfatase activity
LCLASGATSVARWLGVAVEWNVENPRTYVLPLADIWTDIREQTMTQPCPTAKELRSLVDGSLSDIDAQSIELHIERCEVCQHAIQELAADGTFWKSAAKNLSDDKIVGPGLDRVIETLQHQSREDAEEIGEAIELKLSFIEPPVEPGTIGRLRHYDILRVAGRGGMGIVLKAFDRSLRRIVAIKLLAPHLAGNGQARQRFVREGRAAAAISHEHVVTIHAVEESPPFLVMQYVHGETLEERIHRNGSLDVREAVRIALQIAQGLAAAHAQGVVHRDIKPANILLENGVARVRITDFGLARAIDDASLTQSGVVAGTPQYMAPEQASGDAIDERADLFSLGSVLYTMLAGHAPFRATTAMGVLKRLCDNAARSIKEINPETPDWLVVIINRLHAKRPADRFHSATEVVTLLERGLAAMQTGTTPASGWASALRVDAPSETSIPNENTTTQTPSGGRGWTERSEGSPGVSGYRPPTPATHQSQSSFIFTDLGAIAKRLLPPYVRYALLLLFVIVHLAATPFMSPMDMLFVPTVMIIFLTLRIIWRLLAGGRGWTERSEGSPGVSGYRPPTPAIHQSYSSFIFTDLGAIAKRLLPPYPLWLLLVLVGLAVTINLPQAGILCCALALLAFLAPRIFPNVASKVSSTSHDADSSRLKSNQQSSYRSIRLLRLFGWSLLWMLPAIVWAKIFFAYEQRALTGISGDLWEATGEMLGMTAAVYIAWLAIAFYWFQRKQDDGSPMYLPLARWRGILNVACLTAVFFAVGYDVWLRFVYIPEYQRIALRNSLTTFPVPAQQYFTVRIEFESDQDGINVVIENGSPPTAWALSGNTRQSTIPGSPGTFPWHATLGQNTFASGEVTLEVGKTAIIKVPKPKLIDLIAGRWKHQLNRPKSPAIYSEADLNIDNIEVEFQKVTAIFANRNPGSSSRTDMTVQIDESVTPALITLVQTKNGEKSEGIVRFEPYIADPQLALTSAGMMSSMGGGSQQRRKLDKLFLCIGVPGSLRPWQFEADPKQGIELYELIRSNDPESLSRSLALEPLPNETTAAVVKEAVEAWSKKLNVPIERRNSVGIDLTLVPPTSVNLPPDSILSKVRLLLPEGLPAVAENSPQPVPAMTSPLEPKPIVSSPFVISRDVITMAQFQQFVNDTGYVTDAERGTPLSSASSAAEVQDAATSAPVTDSGEPVEDAASIKATTSGTVGGWLREANTSVLPTAAGWHRQGGKFIWHDGLNWKKPTPASVDGSVFPASPDSPLPVVMLSYNDATAFCHWLSTKENRQYRLPTALEWTAAIQLGAVQLPIATEFGAYYEHRTWLDASLPNPLGIRVATEIGGEWTSTSGWPQVNSVAVIVKKDIKEDGKRFDLSHQQLAPPAFRSSELSFRVVAELQAMRTKESNEPVPMFDTY